MSAPVSYYNEISNMMFGFGDSHRPNPDTVRLIESITLNQLRLIVEEATKVQEICRDIEKPERSEDKVTIDGEELIFLMRKNKYKMRRFYKSLQSPARRTKMTNFLQPPPQDEPKPSKLIDFIEYLDETGELTDLTEYDETQYERMVRADRISLALDEKAYVTFAKARSASFMNKRLSQIRNFDHLKLWIDPNNCIKFTNEAMNVLSYYAYETVAQLIDYALLVRLDHNRKPDPLKTLEGTHYSAGMFKADQFTGANTDCSKVYSGQKPISVGEIKEVMRRIFMPQAGQLKFSRRLPKAKNIIAI